uniref:Uncharacterized protein n=1 Tax=Arundo donax TaxID=35708 RepID=A0A0A9H602_ARUDO
MAFSEHDGDVRDGSSLLVWSLESIVSTAVGLSVEVSLFSVGSDGQISYYRNRTTENTVVDMAQRRPRERTPFSI